MTTTVCYNGSISSSLFERINHNNISSSWMKQVQEACKRNEFSSAVADLSGRISSLSEEDLLVFLEELSTHLSLDDHPEKVLHALSESLSREKIEGILKRKYNSFEDAISDAKERLERCKEFLSKTGPTDSPSFSARARHLFECLVAALESFLNAFGVADFFKPSQNSMDAQMKSGQIQSLLYLASFLTTTLGSFSFGPAAGLIVTSVLAFIAALSLVYPYISPMPSYLPEAANFSHMVRMKELPEVYGRKKILDNIANALIESRQVKKHPLLIGESGVGKTKTIEAFVHAIERGDYPELAGKQVFYFSTGKLVNATAMFSSSNNILNRISDAMGRHRENIILVFDEIHEAARAKGETATLSEELKVMLDPGPGRFPFFIGMTTKKEYEEHIKGAFLRRFEEIRVENMGKEDIIKVLSSYLYQSLPSILIEDGAIEYLIEKCQTNFPDKAEPARSLAIIEKCLTLLNITFSQSKQSSNLETATLEFEGCKSRHESRGLFAPTDHEDSEAFRVAKDNLLNIENEACLYKKQAECMLQRRKSLLSLKRKVCKAAESILGAHRTDKQMNFYLLGSYFFAIGLENSLMAQAQNNDMHVQFSKALVDKVLGM